MLKQKHYLTIPFAIALISLVAAGCNEAPKNGIRRPIEESNVNTNAPADSSMNNDNGEVAGAETTQLPTKNIKVNDKQINVEVADTFESQAQGLSNRKKLDDGYGMLFDFGNSDTKTPGFWMKDMLISIDIIWINSGKIVGIKTDAPLPPKDGDLPIYSPPSEITHVLEVPAGWSVRNNVKIGDEVKI